MWSWPFWVWYSSKWLTTFYVYLPFITLQAQSHYCCKDVLTVILFRWKIVNYCHNGLCFNSWLGWIVEIKLWVPFMVPSALPQSQFAITHPVHVSSLACANIACTSAAGLTSLCFVFASLLFCRYFCPQKGENQESIVSVGLSYSILA